MAISRTALFALALPVPAVAYLATSMTPVNAGSQCLPSAQAVMQEYPGAWATWSSHVANHRGVKCWYPVGRETRSRHIETALHHTANQRLRNDTAAGKEAPVPAASYGAVGVPAMAYGAAARENDFRWPPVTIGTAAGAPPAPPSFEDRFAAARDGAPGRKPALIRHLMDPTGAAPDTP